MRKPRLTLTALLALAVIACQQPNDESNIAIDDTFNAANAEIETLPPSEESGAPDAVNDLNGADDDVSEGRSAPIIPAQYRGRWGMVAADCTSTRGDAKGLITVGDNSIRFYESTARLREQRPAIATSFSGLFGLTGEGQTWERVITLTRTGDTLKRADEDGSFTYTRCA